MIRYQGDSSTAVEQPRIPSSLERSSRSISLLSKSDSAVGDSSQNKEMALQPFLRQQKGLQAPPLNLPCSLLPLQDSHQAQQLQPELESGHQLKEEDTFAIRKAASGSSLKHILVRLCSRKQKPSSCTCRGEGMRSIVWRIIVARCQVNIPKTKSQQKVQVEGSVAEVAAEA
ncbi:hypothetical protein R1flu_008568 [Riccia fluitans]|uniref:Uncharacterized protein n=1 Tax=Riccia fluitans TaxID=41844 RepID=A0ABD1YC28_9MARC